MNHVDFVAEVVDLVRAHAPELADERIEVRTSSAAKYVSVTLTIQATGEPQLIDIHEALKNHPLVKLVL